MHIKDFHQEDYLYPILNIVYDLGTEEEEVVVEVQEGAGLFLTMGKQKEVGDTLLEAIIQIIEVDIMVVGEEEAVWEEEDSRLKIEDTAHHMHLKIITLIETLIPTVPTCKVH